LCEIELELKRGNQAELFNVARELMQAVPARLEFKSKSQRGYELLDGERARRTRRSALISLRAPARATVSRASAAHA